MVFRGFVNIRNEENKSKKEQTSRLGLSILEISKTLMYEFWFDYSKTKYQNNTKLCYMNADSFIIYIKTDDVYEGIADDLEKIFDTSNHEVDRPLPTRKNKKVSGLMKDELEGKNMTECAALRRKTYPCLMNNGSNN